MSLLVTLRTSKGHPRRLADADELPTLCNAAGTAGVIRHDTGAVVVAAGTPFVRGGVGQYSYELTGVVAGVTYTAFRKLKLDGIEQINAKVITASPLSALATFLGLAEADELAAQLPGLAAYKAAADDVRLQLLVAATDRVANSRPWQGCKVDPGQALPFPRYRERPYPYQLGTGIGYGVGYGFNSDRESGVWDLDPDTKTPVVPLDVRKATVIEADSIAEGSRARTVEAIHDGVAAKVTGGLQVTYRTDAKGVPLLCQAADLLLQKYVRTSARLT